MSQYQLAAAYASPYQAAEPYTSPNPTRLAGMSVPNCSELWWRIRAGSGAQLWQAFDPCKGFEAFKRLLL